MGINKGIIFNIQRCCTDDGPGIRTNVFLKGCPLRCTWCHNPEGQEYKRQLTYDDNKCIDCRSCASVCKFSAHTFDEGKHNVHRERCKLSGECTKYCPTKALEIVGGEVSVEALVAEIEKDRVFFENSGGGVTLSGGEPMFQVEFTYTLLKELKKRGLHTCMETCGYCKAEDLKRVIPYTDLFLYDIKETDDQLHKKYTGRSNKLILSNLKFLNNEGSAIIIRCPIIPNLNDRESHWTAVADIANSLSNVEGIELEPYHPFGITKLVTLNKEILYNNMKFMKREEAERIAEKIRESTNIPVSVK